MTTINLSGIQAIKPPPALFDEFFEKKSHFAGAKYPEGTEIRVDVVHEARNSHQTPSEPALAVKLDNCTIGYIPVLSTLYRYIVEATEQNDLRRHNKERERYKIVEFLRDHIEQDLFRNHISVQGVLTNVKIGEHTGEVMSVSVGFDYM